MSDKIAIHQALIKIAQTLEVVAQNQTKLGHLITTLNERLNIMDKGMQDLLDQLDAATTATAKRLDALSAKITTSMSPEDVAAIKTAIGAETTRLNAMAADPAEPVPADPIPSPTGETGVTVNTGENPPA